MTPVNGTSKEPPKIPLNKTNVTLGTIAAALISVLTFAVNEITNKPDREQVLQLIKVNAPTRQEMDQAIANDAPYLRDRSMIMERLGTINRNELRFQQVIEENTKAINALRVELAKFSEKQEKP